MTKKPLFYKIYFAAIAVFLVILTVLLVWLNGWLKIYEAAQPINLINSIVDKHLKNGDVDYLLNDCSLKISEYETQENIDAFFKQNTEGASFTSVVLSKRPDGCDAAYTVKSGDKKFLNIYLKKQNNSASFLPTYFVMGSELDSDYYSSITVSMPQNAEITVNGKQLDASLRKESPLPEFAKKYLEGEKTTAQQTATIEYLLDSDVTVSAKLGGKETDVVKNDNTYSVYQYIDADVKKKVQNVATKGSEAYAGYMQADATLADVATYFDTGCDFYKNIRSSYTDHILEHTPAGFDNLENNEVFKYSDNIYSCHVKFTQVLRRNGMAYKIYFDKYVFLKKSGDSFRIIDIKTPEE
ncbi:MAG: hypothetical protein E7526_01460 [Ruminococcaceae bacterium]|nr:hypothetical protein [Oscillospiraceae bacterium]